TLKFSGNKRIISYLIASGFVVISILLAISIGSVQVPIKEIITILGREVLHLPLEEPNKTMYTAIVMNIRLPRVLLAGIVGASLALAGAAFQGLLRNPLADPYTLGVSSGASVGAVVVLFFHISLPFIGEFTVPFLSLIASCVTIVLVLLLARSIEPAMKVGTLILTGILSSSFLGAVLSVLIAVSGEGLRQ